VLDPQEQRCATQCGILECRKVRSVRIGKYLEIDVDGKDVEMEARLQGLCRDLLRIGDRGLSN